ncbi:hypothetical protein K488DRAFT_84268 [Vararia minispora EC-137]|uniref:Uncharacterized protein n=1 Tax=Vararia minispora EC-137 TaxID=1314806 RepID=A0ACB8QQN5_9AGAM|nr:hypothetical protein K488DRAFT_84268 [Vararia minispora EC-137]
MFLDLHPSPMPLSEGDASLQNNQTTILPELSAASSPPLTISLASGSGVVDTPRSSPTSHWDVTSSSTANSMELVDDGEATSGDEGLSDLLPVQNQFASLGLVAPLYNAELTRINQSADDEELVGPCLPLPIVPDILNASYQPILSRLPELTHLRNFSRSRPDFIATEEELDDIDNLRAVFNGMEGAMEDQWPSRSPLSLVLVRNHVV